jgi:hypothetical protein
MDCAAIRARAPLGRRCRTLMASAALLVLGFATGTRSNAAPERVDPALSDERLEASYNSGADFVRDPALDRYLSLVVRRLQDTNPDIGPASIRIHALNSPLPYAFALGNGACYVSTGLIARLDNESQLAAVIAMPVAAIVRHDSDKLSAKDRQHILRSYLPNLLLITVTAGFGAIAVAKADRQAHADVVTQMQAASDAAALQWLANAGYDPSAGPAALRTLRDRLSAEQRSGPNELSDVAALPPRADALDHALSELSIPQTTPLPVDPAGSFSKLSVYFAQRQAAADVDGHAVSVVPILDRLEAGHGVTGVTAFLRAELIRRNSADPASVPVAIDAYERCVAHTDAPPAAFRELAFLYRRAGDAERARQNFTAYLAHSPNASDAPIIRSYLETP